MQLSEIKKSIINVATLIVAVGVPLLSYTTGALPANVALVISGVVAVAGSILHYFAPNTTTDAEVAKVSSVKLVHKRRPTKAAA